jgi:NADPH-dependent glutamate synthase beta subunit-like oxidoreductase
MELSASDEEVMIARRQSLELLMSDHVGDCEAPCSLACPAGMNIPLMNRLIGEEKFMEALQVVKEEIALPFVLGYICPAPCEKACRRKNIDEAVSVCLLKRFSAAAGNDQNTNANRTFSGKKVAIIGSGPAGLAAAYYLQKYGHSCSVFDKSPESGGTLRTSISDDLLPKNVIDQEVEIIRSMGATFHYNALITAQVFNDELRKSYDAVVFATGDITKDNYLSAILPLTKTGYQVNENDMTTALPGVFVCGSAIRPNKMAVRSVAQGKTVADSVHLYFQGRQFEKPAKIFNSRFDKILPAEFDEYLKEASADNRFNPADLLTGFSEMDAVLEARRCLHCDCRKQDNCKLRTYANEYNIDRKRYLVEDRRLMTRQVQQDKIVYE